MNFKQFLENDALEQSKNRILQYYIDTNLRDFIPGKHQNGSLGDIEDLKAVIWSSLHNFPDDGKSVCVISRLIDSTLEGINLMSFARFLEEQGKLKILYHRLHKDIIIGKSDFVDELAELKNNADYSDEYHTRFGQLVGYSPTSIQNFLAKIKAIQARQRREGFPVK